jgi:tRNA (guanine-N7-)-methyltransferase
MRLRKLKNVDERLQSRPEIVVLEPTIYKGKWSQLFGNDNPIYLEIGMGKGKFIIQNAIDNPNINFIGLEREGSVLVKAVEKINSKLANLYFVYFDANNVLDLFIDNEIDKIFLNFSDPWPKTRHSKRRLTYSSNLDNYKRVLNEDQTIAFKTDNRHLFEYSLQMFVAEKLEIVDLSLNLHEDKLNIITTEYEDRFIEKGNIIYYIEVKNGKNEII